MATRSVGSFAITQFIPERRREERRITPIDAFAGNWSAFIQLASNISPMPPSRPNWNVLLGIYPSENGREGRMIPLKPIEEQLAAATCQNGDLGRDVEELRKKFQENLEVQQKLSIEKQDLQAKIDALSKQIDSPNPLTHLFRFYSACNNIYTTINQNPFYSACLKVGYVGAACLVSVVFLRTDSL